MRSDVEVAVLLFLLSFTNSLTTHALIPSHDCRYHRYAQRVLSNVSLEVQSRKDISQVAFCAVDLDKSPELSTYTHFNSIDVMYFYPHLIMNGVRYAGNLTAEGVMKYTYFMFQHTTSQLLSFNNPFTDKNMAALIQYVLSLRM